MILGWIIILFGLYNLITHYLDLITIIIIGMILILLKIFYKNKRIIYDSYPEIIDIDFIPLKFKNVLQNVMAFKWYLVFNTFNGLFFPSKIINIYGEIINKYSNYNILALACGGEGMETFLSLKLIKSNILKQKKIKIKS